MTTVTIVNVGSQCVTVDVGDGRRVTIGEMHQQQFYDTVTVGLGEVGDVMHVWRRRRARDLWIAESVALSTQMKYGAVRELCDAIYMDRRLAPVPIPQGHIAPPVRAALHGRAAYLTNAEDAISEMLRALRAVPVPLDVLQRVFWKWVALDLGGRRLIRWMILTPKEHAIVAALSIGDAKLAGELARP